MYSISQRRVFTATYCCCVKPSFSMIACPDRLGFCSTRYWSQDETPQGGNLCTPASANNIHTPPCAHDEGKNLAGQGRRNS
jgi:hypothetical protein